MVSVVPFSRRLRLAAIAALLGCAAVVSPAQEAALSLDEVIEFAARQSGQLAALRAQSIAAREMAVAAGQRPDPVLKMGIGNVPVEGPERFSTARDSMTMRSVGLMQELTRADKRQARADRALLERDSAAIAIQQTLSVLQRDAAMAWLDRSFQESMKSLLAQQQEKAALQVDVAQSLYRSGRGSHADVLVARALVEQFAERILGTQQQIDIAQTRLARWIGRTASRPLAARPAFTLPEWTRGDVERHLLRHPQVAAMAQAQAIAEADARIASASRRADWSVELMFNQRGSAYSNMVSLNLSVPLQWDQKQRQDRELAARLALVDKTKSDREDGQRAHLAEVQALLQAWRAQAERLDRHRTQLIPLAEQRSAATLAAYRAATGALPAVLEARRAEVDARIDALRLEMEQARVWAELNYLLPHADDIGAAEWGRTTP